MISKEEAGGVPDYPSAHPLANYLDFSSSHPCCLSVQSPFEHATVMVVSLLDNFQTQKNSGVCGNSVITGFVREPTFLPQSPAPKSKFLHVRDTHTHSFSLFFSD